MTEARLDPGVTAGRLPPEQYARNFADLHPPLGRHEALVAADRCYFCHDAPCLNACPTAIDTPLFIRQIATGHNLGAATPLFHQTHPGRTCDLDCPTDPPSVGPRLPGAGR